jgi:hypothetical protein
MLEYDTKQVKQHQIYYPHAGIYTFAEHGLTEPSPYPVGARPDFFIEQALRNPAAAALATAGQSWDTQALDKATLNSDQLGSAVDWCADLIVKAVQNNINQPLDLPDWNLDADRGYGWLNWYWKPYDQNMPKKKISEVFYFHGLEE